ncbi:MAG TPA: ABC transporter permease [Gemmatimonadaceae bacterium]
MLDELWSDLRYRLRAFLRRRAVERELDDELRFHLGREAEKYIARGVPSDEALRRARLAFGGLDRFKEESRDARGTRLLEDVMSDVSFTVRTLVKRPGFTLVAVLTLMLGIGANTAIFSVVSAVLLRPLPYPAADRLAVLWGTRGTEKRLLAAVPDVGEWRARNHTFEDIGIVRTQSVNLTGVEHPDRLIGNFVTASTLRILGARTVFGRTFVPSETAEGTGREVAVLSNAAWRTRFGSDPHILGRTLVLNGRPHVVIGVMAPEFHDPFGPNDVWLPVTSAPDTSLLTRTNPWVWAIGRLKPGVSFADAQRDLSSVAAQLAAEYPTTNAGAGAEVLSLRDSLTGSVRPILLLVLAFVGVVLLIACVNVANLQLARAASRTRELSLRAALGAGRSRLVWQLLTESIVLSILGGVAGVVSAYWVIQLLATALSNRLPVDLTLFGTIGLEPRVLIFTATITVAAGLLFGAIPAFRVAHADPNDALKERPGESGRGRLLGAQHAFVVAELALSIVLLAGAGLLVRSMLALQQVDPGFDARHVLTAEFRLPSVKYGTPEQVTQFMDRALAEVRAVPGVRSAALVQAVPLSGNWAQQSYAPDDHPELRSATAPVTQLNVVSDGFFRTMKIPLLRGRDFGARDRADAQRVAIVNEELARRTWPGESPLGKRLKLIGPPDVWVTVVGVAGDVKQFTLGEPTAPQLYEPIAQMPGIFSSVVARTQDDPMTMANAVRNAIWSVDADQPVWKLRSLESLITRDVAGPRFTTLLVAAFALLALVLATVGVYGAMSFAVAQRTREVGIRMALGARHAEVMRMMLGRGMRVVGIALLVGIPASLGVAYLLRSRLFGVTAADPVTFVVVPVVLAAVAMVACWVPARRAARVDPMVALRGE